jgi:hypothetical protein
MVARPSSVRYPVADNRSDSSAGDPTEYTLFRMSDAEPFLQPSPCHRLLLEQPQGQRARSRRDR